MTDIDALEPVRRDSVCLTCHLEGQAAVTREGRKLENFAPGDNLFDYQVFLSIDLRRGQGDGPQVNGRRCSRANADRGRATG